MGRSKDTHSNECLPIGYLLIEIPPNGMRSNGTHSIGVVALLSCKTGAHWTPLHCSTFQGENMIDTHIKHLPIGSALWIAPYRPLPIGRVLSFFPKSAHIRRNCISSIFQGENIIVTHLYPFAWFARAFVCVVVITAQTKALRNGIHTYRTHWDGHHGDT